MQVLAGKRGSNSHPCIFRNVSELHWSPAGRNIILAGISSTQGALEFFNVDDMSPLRSQQHFMCNNVKWDQTGRYACSWVDAHRDMDHGYIIWSFTGELLYRYGPYGPFLPPVGHVQMICVAVLVSKETVAFDQNRRTLRGRSHLQDRVFRAAVAVSAVAQKAYHMQVMLTILPSSHTPPMQPVGVRYDFNGWHFWELMLANHQHMSIALYKERGRALHEQGSCAGRVWRTSGTLRGAPDPPASCHLRRIGSSPRTSAPTPRGTVPALIIDSLFLHFQVQ